ncbi:allergen [Plectosphaerella plurivora]|uniref:Allergen n=1 Tax=Plectosphaerella plurivora TaxID=936078 RepID=A0A9P8V8X3_9PEZI|nr:allergen [Plectosphaerella plurivora]
MEKAKQAVNKLMSSDGKHTTSVDDNVNPAVTDEHVRPHHHEEVTQVLDKEVHQDHHHTVVQPIKHQETLPEKHTHNMAATTHKTIDHRDDSAPRQPPAAAQFQDKSVTHDTTHSTSAAPMVGGEHIHHHVHEHIQPVIQKETIQPEYTHTTVPIHETHHLEAKEHGTTILPPIGMDDDLKGALAGRKERRVEEYEGCPRTYEQKLQTGRTQADENMHSQAV